MKNNIFIITSHYKDQDSVNEITKNLINTYKKIGKTQILAIEDFTSLPERIESVAIVHPHVFTNSNLRLVLNSIKPSTKIMIHVFGDFMRKSSYYISLQDDLIGKNITFIAASNSYQKLITRALLQANCPIIPFPLSEKIFFPSTELKEKMRRKYNIKKNDRVLIYTGRLSPQKNIKLLINCFKNTSQEHNSPIHLFLVGNFDTIEMATFYDKKYLPGEYFAEINELIQNGGVKNIHFIPRVSHKKLNALYNMADIFVSLSLYHDEDFGYSPIESLMCGTPVLITNWGGYRDLSLHSTIKNKTHFVPVKYSKKALTLNEKIISEKIKLILEKDNKRITPTKFANYYNSNMIGKKILKELKSKSSFLGFNPRFINFSLRQLVNSSVEESDYKYFYSGFWNA